MIKFLKKLFKKQKKVVCSQPRALVIFDVPCNRFEELFKFCGFYQYAKPTCLQIAEASIGSVLAEGQLIAHEHVCVSRQSATIETQI